MIQRTTISMDQGYLDYLKLLAIQKRQNLSSLVNEAVRVYLSDINIEENNRTFFEEMAKLKKELNLNKPQLKKYIQKGRV